VKLEGTLGEFSRLYIKTERIGKEIGRRLNKALNLRNRARYVYNNELSLIEAEEVIKLGEEITQIASDYIERSP
jgi:uncharacterized protein (UPF0332 family)